MRSWNVYASGVVGSWNSTVDRGFSAHFHSTSVRFLVSHGKFSTQIEADVADACATEPVSTSALAHPAQQTPRVIRVMRLDHALAHKIGAWNERRLMRDLYDIYFLHTILGKTPNFPILKRRVTNVRYVKKIARTGRPKTMGMPALCEKLRGAAHALNAAAVAMQLGDYLAPAEYAGLEHKMRRSLLHLIDAVESV